MVLLRPLALAVFLVACNASTDASGPAATLSGNWTDLGNAPSGRIVFTLTQTDTVVSGTGQYGGPSTNGSLVVSGSYHRPNAVLRMTYDVGPIAVYTAQATDANTLVGTYVFTSGPSYPLAFGRQ